VRKAVAAPELAASVRGDKRAGIVWHTQGSGKSLSMVFYAGRLVVNEGLGNPTLVVLTDRNAHPPAHENDSFLGICPLQL
jgi:type I restriction enzyme R subunit